MSRLDKSSIGISLGVSNTFVASGFSMATSNEVSSENDKVTDNGMYYSIIANQGVGERWTPSWISIEDEVLEKDVYIDENKTILSSISCDYGEGEVVIGKNAMNRGKRVMLIDKSDSSENTVNKPSLALLSHFLYSLSHDTIIPAISGRLGQNDGSEKTYECVAAIPRHVDSSIIEQALLIGLSSGDVCPSIGVIYDDVAAVLAYNINNVGLGAGNAELKPSCEIPVDCSAEKRPSDNFDDILVIDWGGSHLSLSILRLSKSGNITFLNNSIAASLGGSETVDRALSLELAASFCRKTRLDCTKSEKAMRKLRSHVEGARKSLSMPNTTNALISVEALFEGIDLQEKISQAKLEMCVRDMLINVNCDPLTLHIAQDGAHKYQCKLLQKCNDEIKSLITKCKEINKKLNVRHIIVSGGFSRTPLVSQYLKQALPKILSELGATLREAGKNETTLSFYNSLPGDEVPAIGAAVEASMRCRSYCALYGDKCRAYNSALGEVVIDSKFKASGFARVQTDENDENTSAEALSIPLAVIIPDKCIANDFATATDEELKDALLTEYQLNENSTRFVKEGKCAYIVSNEAIRIIFEQGSILPNASIPFSKFSEVLLVGIIGKCSRGNVIIPFMKKPISINKTSSWRVIISSQKDGSSLAGVVLEKLTSESNKNFNLIGGYKEPLFKINYKIFMPENPAVVGTSFSNDKEVRKVNCGNVENCLKTGLHANKQISGFESIAASVTKWKRNRFITYFFQTFVAKVPNGAREFVLVAPIALIMGVIVFKSKTIMPGGLGARANYEEIRRLDANNKESVLSVNDYRLEPVYGPDGRLKAYKRTDVN